MDKTIRKVTDLEDQQAETFRYWQSRPVAERLIAAEPRTTKDLTFGFWIGFRGHL